jgi:hypothetical protein
MISVGGSSVATTKRNHRILFHQPNNLFFHMDLWSSICISHHNIILFLRAIAEYILTMGCISKLSNYTALIDKECKEVGYIYLSPIPFVCQRTISEYEGTCGLALVPALQRHGGIDNRSAYTKLMAGVIDHASESGYDRSIYFSPYICFVSCFSYPAKYSTVSSHFRLSMNVI